MYKKLISATVFLGAFTTILNASDNLNEDQSRISPSHRYVLQVESHKPDIHSLMGLVNILNPKNPRSEFITENSMGWNARIVELRDTKVVEGLLGASTDPEDDGKSWHFIFFEGLSLQATLGTEVILCQDGLKVGQKISCSALKWLPFAKIPEGRDDFGLLYFAMGLAKGQ